MTSQRSLRASGPPQVPIQDDLEAALRKAKKAHPPKKFTSPAGWDSPVRNSPNNQRSKSKRHHHTRTLTGPGIYPFLSDIQTLSGVSRAQGRNRAPPAFGVFPLREKGLASLLSYTERLAHRWALLDYPPLENG